MGNKVTVTRGDETFVFDNIVMHQIGNGAVQIVERSGSQRVINNYDDVFIELDEEATAAFQMDLAQMEAGASVPDEATEEGEIPEELKAN